MKTLFVVKTFYFARKQMAHPVVHFQTVIKGAQPLKGEIQAISKVSVDNSSGQISESGGQSISPGSSQFLLWNTSESPLPPHS
jgi:hypothetical protein